MMDSQAQELPSKAFQCSNCVIIFKSKIYLFEHLNKVHGYDVDSALREAGLKQYLIDKDNPDNNSDSSGNIFLCQYCGFQSFYQDIFSEHEKLCQKKSENLNAIVNISENLEAKIIVPLPNQDQEGTGEKEISTFFSVMSNPKTQYTSNSSEDLETANRPLQTITEYFTASSGSKGNPPAQQAYSPMFLDGTEGTLILQESPSNSSGVFKVTAKSTIDTPRNGSNQFLLNDHLLMTDSRSPQAEAKFMESFPNTVGKRTSNESSRDPPAKKAKLCKEETEPSGNTNIRKQQSSRSTDFSFEAREDGEECIDAINEDTENPKKYFCKHCDYSDVNIRHVSIHYQNKHPYVRYNTVYLQDPNDQSSTFRCLECPVEFVSVPDLKRHYTENHPEAPDVFTMQSHELNLVFKCFVCQFTTTILKTLKEHYTDMHSIYEVDNSLLYYRYSATRCQKVSTELITCDKAPNLKRTEGNSPESAHTPSKEVKNASSPQHPTSCGADKALYHCNICDFSHKSVVVMHVHYQKSHPDEPVTIDKMKWMHTALKMPEKSPNTVTVIENCKTQKNISESSKKAKDEAEMSEQKISSCPKHTSEDSKTCLDSPKPEKVEPAEDRSKTVMSLTKQERETSTGMDGSSNEIFYCRFCSYSSTKIRSILGHCNAKHIDHGPTSFADLMSYSAELQKKKVQCEAKASPSTASIDAQCSTQLCHEEDDVVDASMMGFNSYKYPEKLFYCQKCNFGNPSLKGVLNHQSRTHRRIHSNKERVLKHTALIREEIEKSKSNTKESPFDSYLPLPLMNEGDENVFFCHFCNYRHSAMDEVLRHYLQKHPEFEGKTEQIHLYTSLVLEKTQKLHLKKAEDKDFSHAATGNEENEKKTKELAKCIAVSQSPSVRASQTQRTLQCHRCSYTTQYVYLLRRHIWKIHRSNHSCNQVLRACFKQGNLQTGYHCDLCVFSHENAAALYKHYQDEHPGRKISFEYMSTRLYVGPELFPLKREKPPIKRTNDGSDGSGTDGILTSQGSGDNETKTYSCKACTFKGSSMRIITRHYRAVHPWSVKEDGSVLGVVSKRRSINQFKDHNEIPESFDTYQIPLEFDKLSESSDEPAESPRVFKCSYCPAKFHTQHSLSTHCGMKHKNTVTEESDEQQEWQVQNQTRVHVFKCPYCTYINSHYQGVTTHCQMRHPALVSRADSLHVDKRFLQSLDDSLKTSGSGDSLRYRGYMCKTCQQICATPEKLNKHCKKDHKVTAPSFLRKKIYAVVRCQHCSYSCSTKIALSRHILIHHRNPSVVIKDCAYKCLLCPRSYFRKKHLGRHYDKKHGRDAFLKYYAPVYKKVLQRSPSHPSTQQPESASEALKSSTTNNTKILVYKCPTCPYVNASYHGTLTHCQMIHPNLVARADELKTDEILVTNMIRCTMGKGSNERGYKCNKCPQIHASMLKLKNHCKRDHGQAEPADFDNADETETEEQPEYGSVGSSFELAALKNITSASRTTDLGQQLGFPGTCQSNAHLVQNKEPLYKCYICAYTGSCRKYLYCHYKHTHKLDALSMYKLMEKYNKRKCNAPNWTRTESVETAPMKCQKCSNLSFDSSQLLISHYSSFHRSDYNLDFTVLSQSSKKSSGIYRCSHCKKQISGITNLSCHLDHHRAHKIKEAKAAETQTSSEAKCIEVCRQDELPLFETVEELAQWNVTQVQTFTLPTSPVPSASKPTDLEQPELETRDEHSCKMCRRTFMSMRGLRLHEHSHATLAAIKKLDNLPPSVLKHNIKKYIIYKSGTLRPFMCSICSFRTTVLGLWKSHFMKKHQDLIMDTGETDKKDEENLKDNKESLQLVEEINNSPEPDEEPELTEKSLYLEPPDVQRQLNQYSLMAQIGVSSKADLQQTVLPDNSLLHCEFCNFSTGHQSSMRRHYLNRHGKKVLKCKGCEFFTGIRKTLEMHMETGHSTLQTEPDHQKDFCCPFCLYQTKNKNNMIDHIVLHREERLVPIEVRRPKLSRYLQGIVFRCHKCTFTSGSAENLHLHMVRHNDVRPYKCRLCYYDCTQLSNLEAHLSDKHQVLRNHDLVGEVSLDQLEGMVDIMPEVEEEPLPPLEQHNSDHEDGEAEEIVTDCSEFVHETLTGNPTENYFREKTSLQMQEADQKHMQEPQRHVGVVLLSDTAAAQGMKNTRNDGGNADNQSEYFSVPGMERQEENQAQVKQRDSDNSSIRFSPPKEEVTESSPLACVEKTEKTQAPKSHIKELPHRTSNMEAVVEDDILHHILEVDEDQMVKMGQNNETEVVGNVVSESQLLNEEGSITMAHISKNPVNMEAVISLEKKNPIQLNNTRAQDSLKTEKLTSVPSCAQLEISHKGNLGVSFGNCIEEVHSQKNSEEITDSYREMPVLMNVFQKEEAHLLGCCKEEEDTDNFEQKQDREGKMIIEDENQCNHQEQEEGAGIREGDIPCVHRVAATDGAALVLHPLLTEKLYTCELCGRNLLNSYELTRHIMRHGI